MLLFLVGRGRSIMSQEWEFWDCRTIDQPKKSRDAQIIKTCLQLGKCLLADCQTVCNSTHHWDFAMAVEDGMLSTHEQSWSERSKMRWSWIRILLRYVIYRQVHSACILTFRKPCTRSFMVCTADLQFQTWKLSNHKKMNSWTFGGKELSSQIHGLQASSMHVANCDPKSTKVAAALVWRWLGRYPDRFSRWHDKYYVKHAECAMRARIDAKCLTCKARRDRLNGDLDGQHMSSTYANHKYFLWKKA